MVKYILALIGSLFVFNFAIAQVATPNFWKPSGGGTLSPINTSTYKTINLGIPNCNSTDTSATGTLICGSDETGGGSGVKIPNIIVAPAGGDFTTLEAAILAGNSTATYPNGVAITIAARTSTLAMTTTTGVTIQNRMIISGHGGATRITWAPTSKTTTLFRGDRALSGVFFNNLLVANISSTYAGIPFDFTNMSNGGMNNVRTETHYAALNMTDTLFTTYYNNFTNLDSTDDNCILSSSTNQVNDNKFFNITCRPNQSLSATDANPVFAFNFNNAQGNTVYGLSSEPASAGGADHATGTFGVYLSGVNTANNSFYGIYLEGNATNTFHTSDVQRTRYFGGQAVAPRYSQGFDTGKETAVMGVNGGAGTAVDYWQFPITTSTDFISSVPNGRGVEFKNDTVFAHNIGYLVRMMLRNATDASHVLQINNAGTSSSIHIFDGSGNTTFSVTNNSTTVSTTLTVQGTSTFRGPVLDANGNKYSTSTGGSATINGFTGSNFDILAQNNSGVTTTVVNGSTSVHLALNNSSTQTCGGTDKVSAINSKGIVTCSTDQTGGGGSSVNFRQNSSTAFLTSSSVDISGFGQIRVATTTNGYSIFDNGFYSETLTAMRNVAATTFAVSGFPAAPAITGSTATHNTEQGSFVRAIAPAVSGNQSSSVQFGSVCYRALSCDMQMHIKTDDKASGTTQFWGFHSGAIATVSTTGSFSGQTMFGFYKESTTIDSWSIVRNDGTGAATTSSVPSSTMPFQTSSTYMLRLRMTYSTSTPHVLEAWINNIKVYSTSSVADLPASTTVMLLSAKSTNNVGLVTATALYIGSTKLQRYLPGKIFIPNP